MSIPNRPIVARLAADLIDDLPTLAARLVDRILANEPDSYGRLPIDDLNASCTENLRNGLGNLAHEQSPDPARAEATARRRAEQGIPVEAVLHAFRLGFSVIWEAMVERVSSRPRAELLELLRGGNTVWEVTDAHSTNVSTAYREMLADFARQDEQRRTLLLDALFEGRPSDWRELAGMARSIGLPDEGPYVAVSGEPGQAGTEALPQVEQRLRRDGVLSAWRLRADEHVGVVALSGDRAPTIVPKLLDELATGRVGLSHPFDDLMDTARALERATIARRSLRPGQRGVATIGEDPIGGLLAGSPELSRSAAHLLLGDLLDTGEEERRVLLTTLETWMAVAGNVTEAGRRLFCHRNTVRNRLHRLEDLTGRALSDPQGLAELYVAVQALRLHDPSVFDGCTTAAPERWTRAQS